MIQDSPAFQSANESDTKDPRYVVSVAFDQYGADRYYFTSHPDTALPPNTITESDTWPVGAAEEITPIFLSDVDYAYFGGTTVMSEDGLTLVVVAPHHTGVTDYDEEYLYVYFRDSTDVPFGAAYEGVTALDPISSWGNSVAISGDGQVLFVSAPNISAAGIRAGRVRVYRRVGYSFLAHSIAYLAAPPEFHVEDSADNFGWKLSTNYDGTKVVIGSPFSNISYRDDGIAYVFTAEDPSWSSFTSKWLHSTPSSSYWTDDQQLGYSVKMSPDGRYSFIGCKTVDGTGHVQVFDSEYPSSDPTFEYPIQVIEAFDGEAGDNFGATGSIAPYKWAGDPIACSLDGRHLVIGAHGWDDAAANMAGALYYYYNDGSGWSFVQQITLPFTETTWFGYCVHMSHDGNRLFAGLQSADTASYTDEGRVAVFSLGPDGYELKAYIYSGNPQDYGYFGFTVSGSADGKHLVSGAPDEDTVSYTDRGNAYVYSLDFGTAFTDCLQPPSGTSQRYHEAEGRSDIGTVDFTLTDVQESISTLIRNKLAAGYGLRKKDVELWVGYKGLEFSDYRQIASQVVYKKTQRPTAIDFICADRNIQHEGDIFDSPFTYLLLTIGASDSVLEVADTILHEPVEHGFTYSEHPAYNAGTISVTIGSPTVTGSGTSWLSVRIAAGSRIHIGGVDYFLLSVDSDTQVTLASNYQGSTAGGLAYSVWPYLYYLRSGDEIINATGKVEFDLIITGTDISFDTSDDSINSTTTDLSPIPIGARVYITGTTSNNTAVIVTSKPSANKLLTDTNLVTEAAGASVTLTTPVQFYDCERGAYGTTAAAVTVNPADDLNRKPKIVDFPYYQMPAPKLSYALRTGVLVNQGARTIPSRHRLHVDPVYVNLESFTNVGVDWWDASDEFDGGMVLVFAGEKKQNGRKFLEEQIDRNIGALTYMSNTGLVTFKRLTPTLFRSAYVGVLNSDNVSSWGALDDDMPDVQNVYRFRWGYDALTQKPTIENDLYDIGSSSVHGDSELLVFEIRGMQANIHTLSFMYGRFDTLRDRKAGPPAVIEVTALGSANQYEIGDVLFVENKKIRDSTNPIGYLSRSMEVHDVKIDYGTGQPVYTMKGSSRAATPVSNLVSDTVLNDTAYSTSAGLLPGNKLDAVLTTTLISGVLHITAGGTLTGGTDMNDPDNIYWYDGPVTIDSTVNDADPIVITDNVRLMIMGFFQRNGKIDGKGQGKAPVDDSYVVTPYSGYTYTQYSAETGYIGSAKAGGGFRDFTFLGPNFNYGYLRQCTDTLIGVGLHSSVPYLNLENSGDSISGLPADMRGVPGGHGLETKSLYQYFSTLAGGAGGNGGASLCIVCRGSGSSPSGSIDLSGADGGVGATFTHSTYGHVFSVAAGAGGGGFPGVLTILLDGKLAIEGGGLSSFVAQSGRGPSLGTRLQDPRSNWVNRGDSSVYHSHYEPYPQDDYSEACFKVQFIPEQV